MSKVLHVSYFDSNGGAARAALRIHTALRHANSDSRMLVVRKNGCDPSVHGIESRRQRLMINIHQMVVDRIVRLQHDQNAELRSLGLFSSGLTNKINQSEANLVNLHWIGGEALSISEVAAIRSPIVWTMHDMWPFCGAEHYEDLKGTPRWLSGYRIDREQSASGLDIDRWNFSRKKRLWKDRVFHLVAPSRWIAECARRSALFARMPCRVIPNCINLSIYKPLERRVARERLNLDPSKKYVLFGAMSSMSCPRKGFRLLQDAMHRLAECDVGKHVELLVFGAEKPAVSPDFGLPVSYLGNFSDDLALSLLYAAADVFAAPSMQDNLPNTIIESLAAGTPPVVFDIGGMADLVEDGVCGFVVPAFDTATFALRLEHLLNGDIEGFARAARAKAEATYSEAIVARQYRTLYEEILDSRAPPH